MPRWHLDGRTFIQNIFWSLSLMAHRLVHAWWFWGWAVFLLEAQVAALCYHKLGGLDLYSGPNKLQSGSTVYYGVPSTCWKCCWPVGVGACPIVAQLLIIIGQVQWWWVSWGNLDPSFMVSRVTSPLQSICSFLLLAWAPKWVFVVEVPGWDDAIAEKLLLHACCVPHIKLLL